MNEQGRIYALLDAFVNNPTENGGLGLHESNKWPHLAETVIAWARERKIRIETSITTSHGRTYEVWKVGGYDGGITVWPLKMGMLDEIDSLKKRIEAIRAEADERIRELVEAEKARAAP